MTTKIEKIKALAKKGKGGERTAAIAALRRKGMPLDIELRDGMPVAEETALALNEITLIPIAMITPTEACIYAPSRIRQPQTFTLNQWLKMRELTISVSLADDGKSNPQKMTCYMGHGGYWMVR